jgi:hypothetical protein
VHGRFNLELAVEIVLGWIDRDSLADFAVEVEPQEILIFWRDADHAVVNADGNLAGRNPDIFKLGKIERVAAELNPHFLAAQRASVKNLLAYEKEVNERFAKSA